MRKKYIKPSIWIIGQVYYEGLMQTWSTGVSTGTAPGGVTPGAKEGYWGDVWSDNTKAESNADDVWIIKD